MKLERSEHGFSVSIPFDVIAALGLTEGDEVEVEVRRPSEPVSDGVLRLSEAFRAVARTIPADFKFDRDEANAR